MTSTNAILIVVLQCKIQTEYNDTFYFILACNKGFSSNFSFGLRIRTKIS